ncbi:hypothetical protein HDU76_003201 [Blyttiomyces sp. JEL0837]|nr:hypothetical protein HDU76_003201 [Blyttiomyces sp. JEL0837]
MADHDHDTITTTSYGAQEQHTQEVDMDSNNSALSPLNFQKLLIDAWNARQTRNADLLLTLTSRALAILKAQTSQSTTPSTDLLYLWSLFTFLRSWALEETESFESAASCSDDILQVMQQQHQPLNLTTTQNPFATSLPPLPNPHPLNPINRSALQIRSQRLKKLSAQVQGIRHDKAPAILDKSSTQALLYRIQLVNLPIVIPSDEIGGQSQSVLKIECMMTSEMGLYRAIDFVGEKVVTTCQVFPHPDITGSEESTSFERLQCTADGRGRCSFTIPFSQLPTSPFCISISSEHSLAMPLVTGPIDPQSYLSNTDNTPALKTLRPVTIPKLASDLSRQSTTTATTTTVLIHEQSDSGIHGRIWDSAYILCDMLSTLAQRYISNHKTSNTKPIRVLDIGCGVGVAGIAFAAMGLPNGNPVEVALTDLGDALELAKVNLEANRKVLTRSANVYVKELVWGDVKSAQELGKFHIVLASDVVYETQYFKDLIETLRVVSGNGDNDDDVETEIWLMYKRRGLDLDEEVGFFDELSRFFEE